MSRRGGWPPFCWIPTMLSSFTTLMGKSPPGTAVPSRCMGYSEAEALQMNV